MKIGIIPPSTRTGESRYGEYLVQGLIEQGLEVEILTNRILTNQPNIKLLFGSFFLKKIIKDKEISILHNLDNLGPLLIKHELKSIKTIQNVFDIAPLILPEIHSPIIKLNFKYMLPRLIKNSDSIIVSSNSTKKDIVSYFGTEETKINVIHLGVDKSFFYPRLQDDVLLKYGINNDFLIFTGGDNPRKNLKCLIVAYAEIFESIPIDLVLVGPINTKNIEKIIGNLNNAKCLLDRIIITGFVDSKDLPILYSSATALVFPSLYEGFGFPPLESMACGTPVIVSNNSSLNEIVGEAGFYIDDPTDPKEIAEKILEMINQNKNQKKFKDRGIIQSKKFDWDTTVKKTIKVYDNIFP